MAVNLREKDLEQLVVMGDKVLIKPKFPQEKTQSGLYLPPTVIDKEQVSLGYVIKTGPFDRFADTVAVQIRHFRHLP